MPNIVTGMFPLARIHHPYPETIRVASSMIKVASSSDIGTSSWQPSRIFASTSLFVIPNETARHAYRIAGMRLVFRSLVNIVQDPSGHTFWCLDETCRATTDHFIIGRTKPLNDLVTTRASSAMTSVRRHAYATG